MSIIGCAHNNDFLFPTHCLELSAFEFRMIFMIISNLMAKRVIKIKTQIAVFYKIKHQ